MPAVKKPKPQKIKAQATSCKTSVQTKKVVSGQLKKKLPKEKPKAKPRPERGVVFIKHLPHGFFEQQLRQYFKQFGNVTRVRLARSERTGGSKGFAFVEFQYPEVAKVAADTMDNYLMFQKVVKASYIPPEQQKFNFFKNTVKKVKNKAGKEIYVSGITKARQTSVKKQNDWNESACQKRTVAGIKKLKKIQQKFNHLGINFSELYVEPVKKSEASTSAKEQSTSGDKAATKEKSKTKPKQPQLEDLLGTTINDDSDDEDYVDDSDDDVQLNSEDTDTDDDDEDEDEDEELEDEEELKPAKSQKKKGGVERSSDLLKRKPGTGGVQKKKLVAPASTKQAKSKKGSKQSLQLAAAKQIAKPLQKVKAGKKLKK
ncbi:hypothetical protein KR222_003657 [Zaprionus bogoriensis]|nr:hypothetical protein KR222_003657 [Zaprionus bogoriensis]